jgi:predicted acetyltransferase
VADEGNRLLRVGVAQSAVVRDLLMQYRDASGEHDVQELHFRHLFHEERIAAHWAEGGSSYLVTVQGALAGLALARHDQGAQGLRSEFTALLVLRRFRRLGVGTWTMYQLFRLHRGDWTFTVRVNDPPWLRFVRRVVRGYAEGRYPHEDVASLAQKSFIITMDNTLGRRHGRTAVAEALPFTRAAITRTPLHGVPILPPGIAPIPATPRPASAPADPARPATSRWSGPSR